MKTTSNRQQVAQGDVLITPVESVPEGFEKAKPEKDGSHIITHSETGHHHVMPSQTVEFYQAANDPFVAYINVKEISNLTHLRSFDTHKPISFVPGVYRINRQREMTPRGWERVAD